MELSSSSTYNVGFYDDENWPCENYYTICVNDTDTAHIHTQVLNDQGAIMTTPELVSVVYESDSGVINGSGVFTLEELEIDALDNRPTDHCQLLIAP